MAEVKNAFLKSKMNKDLDARLLPSGEYRDAMNISISKSEGSDVGAVENIKGNKKLFDINTEESTTGLDIIGIFMDETNNYIYTFSTNSNVSETEDVNSDAKCFIHRCKINFNTGTTTIKKLVEGSFLNFTKNSFITGVHLLEDLLFFTDNRNQPRVINVTSASNDVSYYNREENISVAKIAPFEAISFYRYNEEQVTTATIDSNTFTITTPASVDPVVGDFVSQGNNEIGVVVSYLSGTVTIDREASVTTGSIKFSSTTMVNKTSEFLNSYNGSVGDIDNPNYDALKPWEGDPDFLEDKFIRFSYRYKFDDNQYSILAPFTSPVFIPKQFGYLVGSDEELAYKSSIIAFMENFVQEADLKIPFPSKDPVNDYKIKEVDIIYKESDQISIKVLSTLQVDSIGESELEGDNNYYTFKYQSKKPYKTLPSDSITRVYDKVPVKAKTQEIISNRIVYANYKDKNNAPSSIDYYVTAQKKDYARYDLTSQYPFHNLKQNRTYQLGVVLSDKYGRTSSVILSSKDINSGDLGRGSTYYHPYTDEDNNNPLAKPNGDALRVVFELAIDKQKTSLYPGVYADDTGKSFDLTGLTTSINNNTYTLNGIDLTGKISAGNYLKGKNIDYVRVTEVTYSAPSTTVITTDGQVADYYAELDSTSVVFGYVINDLGWYSYKIVVKQNEQDYYNVFLPLTVNGGFDSTDNPDVNQEAQTVLINDNINKVPRDLSEVGPQQKQFRSSVKLFGRVNPTGDSTEDQNTQWYPSNSSDDVATIMPASDLGYDVTTSPVASLEAGMYKYKSDPYIAVISSRPGINTVNSFGKQVDTDSVQTLSIYETSPVISVLDLFYETGTSGLISELNKEIANTGEPSASDVINYTFSFNESDEASVSTPFDITSNFMFIDPAGNILDGVAIPNVPTIVNVVNGNGNTISNPPFQVVDGDNDGEFKIQSTSSFTYIDGSETLNDWTFTISVIANDIETNIRLDGALTNSTPTSTLADPYIITGAAVDSNDWVKFEETPNPIVSNGSAVDSEIFEGLTYTITRQQIVNQVPLYVDAFVISGNGVLSKKPGSLPFQVNEEFEIDIQIKDAGGSNPNTMSITQEVQITFGPSELNIPDGDTDTGTGSGPGCENNELRVFSDAYIYIFGDYNINPDSSLPSGVASPNQWDSVAGGLTSGSMELKLHSDWTLSTCDHTGSAFRVWVQYRETSSSPWVSAIQESSSPGPNGSYYTPIEIGSTDVGEIYLGTFDTVGEYRVIVNPSEAQVGTVCANSGCSGVFRSYISWNDPN